MNHHLIAYAISQLQLNNFAQTMIPVILWPWILLDAYDSTWCTFGWQFGWILSAINWSSRFCFMNGSACRQWAMAFDCLRTEKIDFDANSLLGKKIRREFQINTKFKFRPVESLSNVTHFIFVSFTLFIDKYIVNQSTDNLKYCTISIIRAKHTTSTVTEQEKGNKTPTKWINMEKSKYVFS